jgi:hypothetical protein
VGDAADPHQQDVRADDGDQHDGHQHHVPQQHLAEIHRPPERAKADRVEGVLAARGDPLRVKVLLRQVAGEALDDRGHERDHAGDPGGRPAAPPGGHPELPPQVDNQEGHEQLDAPQVKAVEEMAHRVRMPPVDPADRDGEPGDDRHSQRGEAGHAEHVDPRGDVRGLAVGQQLARRHQAQCPPAQPRRPHVLVLVLAQVGPAGLPGNARERTGIRARRQVCLRRVGVALGERQDQRHAENDHHNGNKHQVRHRNGEYGPMHVGAWLVEVDHPGTGTCQGGNIHFLAPVTAVRPWPVGKDMFCSYDPLRPWPGLGMSVMGRWDLGPSRNDRGAEMGGPGVTPG